MKRPFEVTYDWMESVLRGQREALRNEKFAHVVAILRGGTVPGFIAAQLIDTDLKFLHYERPTGEVKWHSPAPVPSQKILLVDDIAGQGLTLVHAKAFLESEGHEVKTLTVGWDEKSFLKPDFSTDLRNRTIIFPWERHRLHPEFISDLAVGSAKKDSDYDLVGIDLDGLLLPDIDPKSYERDIIATLLERDQLAPFSQDLLPSFTKTAAVIITARPEEDEARTRDWLKRHGFAELPLVLRDNQHYPHTESARYKADKARELGVTRFYESDLLQAATITHYNPLLDVYCWNNDQRLRIRMGQSVRLDLSSLPDSTRIN